MATGLASFRVYIAAPTSLVADHGHPIPAYSVSWAVKPPHLVLRAKVVFVSAAIRLFENTQDTTMYNKFLEVASDDEE